MGVQRMPGRVSYGRTLIYIMWDLLARDSGFSQFKLTIVGTFHDLLMKGIPEKFPDVRWGFVEVSPSGSPTPSMTPSCVSPSRARGGSARTP